jgi:hypothetical protein
MVKNVKTIPSELVYTIRSDDDGIMFDWVSTDGEESGVYFDTLEEAQRDIESRF